MNFSSQIQLLDKNVIKEILLKSQMFNFLYFINEYYNFMNKQLKCVQLNKFPN